MEMDIERRFSGVRRLYGEAGLTKLQAAHFRDRHGGRFRAAERWRVMHRPLR